MWRSCSECVLSCQHLTRATSTHARIFSPKTIGRNVDSEESGMAKSHWKSFIATEFLSILLFYEPNKPRHVTIWPASSTIRHFYSDRKKCVLILQRSAALANVSLWKPCYTLSLHVLHKPSTDVLNAADQSIQLPESSETLPTLTTYLHRTRPLVHSCIFPYFHNWLNTLRLSCTHISLKCNMGWCHIWYTCLRSGDSSATTATITDNK